MATKRKTLVLLGHSNGQGWGGSKDLFASAPELVPSVSPDDPRVENVYPGIYVATDPIPWPDAAGTPDHSYSPGDMAWLEMTHNLPTSPGDEHPHPSPYHYPNIRGAWYPMNYHDATNRAGGGTFVGVEIPLMWKLSHYWSADDATGVGLMKQTLSSTLFLRRDVGGGNMDWVDAFNLHATYTPADPSRSDYPWIIDPAYTVVPWWTPSDKFDWATNTGRLYDILLTRLEAAQNNMPDDITMDVEATVLWFGDNDSTLASEDADQTRIANFESDMRKWIAKYRSDLYTGGYTSRNEHEIKIILMGVSNRYGDTTSILAMNTAYQNIAADDPYVRYVDVADYEYNNALGYTDIYVSSSTHFSANGYLDAADDIMDAIAEMDVEPFDALDDDTRITLANARERVTTYYTRSRTNTDATDATLNQYINAALFDILNEIADNAWFLRRRMVLSISASSGQAYTLPKIVHRLLRIEAVNDATYPLKWEEVGRTAGGKVQVVMKERLSGDLYIHFFTQPREMRQDDELVPLPFQMIEWLVVEAAKRLARSGGNAALLGHLEGEAARQRALCIRNLGAMQQGRRDRMASQRRMVNFSRHRAPFFPTDRI